MKLGIGTYSLTWSIGVPDYPSPSKPMTAESLLETASSLGLRVVQYADNLPLHLMDEQRLASLKTQADQLGIVLEVGTRGTTPELLLDYLKVAKAIGSSLVRTLITTADLSQAEMDLRSVLQHYEEEGVAIAIENHGLHKSSQLAAFFEKLNRSYVGCCLDTVNSFGTLEPPEQVIRSLAPYTINLHIKDFDIRRANHQMGFSVLGAPVGAGKLDLDFTLSELGRHKKSPNAIIELWTPFQGTVEETIRLEQEWLLQSAAYLKNRITE
ncbi:MAG: Xylose isomerase domain protein barrel [Paenibacillus sp.]|nr:Xylose isomerase domain protein barrel [Paenibacillus sp.]